VAKRQTAFRKRRGQGATCPKCPRNRIPRPFSEAKASFRRMTAQTHLLTYTGLSGGIRAKRTGRCIGTTPLRGLGITDAGAFPDRHYVQVKDRLAWLAGQIRQSEIPPIRRDSGDLISDMRIPEPDSRGMPRFCSGSRETAKRNVSRTLVRHADWPFVGSARTGRTWLPTNLPPFWLNRRRAGASAFLWWTRVAAF